MQKNYHVFLLRIWEDDSLTHPCLHILLEDPQTHALVKLDTTYDLPTYLNDFFASAKKSQQSGFSEENHE